MPCPNYVFKLQAEQSFRVGSVSHSGNFRHVESKNVSLIDHLTILHYLYPNATDEDFEFMRQTKEVIKNIQRDMDNLDKEESFFQRHPSMYGLIPSFILVVIVFYWIGKCLWKRRQERIAQETRHREATSLEMVPMHRRQRRVRIRNVIASDEDE